MEAGNIAQQIIEAGAGHPPGGVHIDAIKGLHDVGVVRDFEVGHQWLTETLDLHIGGVVWPNGDGGVDDLGDHQHDFSDLLSKGGFLCL